MRQTPTREDLPAMLTAIQFVAAFAAGGVVTAAFIGLCELVERITRS